MALTVTHATAADGTFSPAGETAWEAAHTVVGSAMAIGDAVSGGIATRLLYVDGSGNLADSANLTFDGTGKIILGGVATQYISKESVVGQANSLLVNAASYIMLSAANISLTSDGGTRKAWYVADDFFAFSNTTRIAFTDSATNAGGTIDTGISRGAAGRVTVGTGAAGSFAGSVKLTDLYTNNATYLIRTNTTLTDVAGLAVGTLTNAPTAGDPTKWIGFDDNGTLRKIPTWT